MMSFKHKLVKVVCLLIILFLFILAVALFLASYLPFELVKTVINNFDNIDKNSSSFHVALFNRIIVNCRIISTSLFVLSGAIFIGRTKAQQYFSCMLSSLFAFTDELIRHSYKAVRKEDRIHLYGFFIILLLAVAVRLCFLFQPIRYDEASTFLTYASKPLFIGLSYYNAPNNHLFHTLLVHMAYLLLGNQPWVLRLPALFAGILLVPLSYVVARILFNKHAALLAAGFIASSSALIGFSTNARGYTLICLIFLTTLALGTYLIRKRNSAAWLLFVILSALGFYTIPIMLYPFGIVSVWIFLSIVSHNTIPHRHILLKNFFISLAATALLTFMLYTPVFAVTGLKSVLGKLSVAGEEVEFFLASFSLTIHSVWNAWNRDMPIVIRFLLIIGLLTSLIFHKQLTSYRIPIILAVVLWLVPLLMAQRVVPYERILIFLLPLYIILACSGISYLTWLIELKINSNKTIVSTILAITISCWISGSVIYTQSVYYSSEGALADAEAITIFLKGYLRPGDKVLAVIPSYYPLLYYFDRYDVPHSYLVSSRNLYTEWNFGKRRFVIVNELNGQILKGISGEEESVGTNVGDPREIERYRSAGQTLKKILGEKRGLDNSVGDVREIQRYKSGALYEINRNQ